MAAGFQECAYILPCIEHGRERMTSPRRIDTLVYDTNNNPTIQTHKGVCTASRLQVIHSFHDLILRCLSVNTDIRISSRVNTPTIYSYQARSGRVLRTANVHSAQVIHSTSPHPRAFLCYQLGLRLKFGNHIELGDESVCALLFHRGRLVRWGFPGWSATDARIA